MLFKMIAGCMMVFCLVFSSIAKAETLPFWKLVGKSHLIVEGRIRVPKEALRAAEQSGKHTFVQVPFTVNRVYKGEAEDGAGLVFRYYTDSGSYEGLTQSQLTALDGREVVLFLITVDGRHYPTAYSPATIQPATSELGERIGKETVLQDRLIREFEIYAATHTLPHESELKQLIHILVNPDAEPHMVWMVYEEIFGFGPEAVPALIKLMDDRRRLVIPKISVPMEYEDGSEGMAHYGPEVVTDVISVLLTELTGERLTQIYNGGTELDRQTAVRLWKLYDRMHSRP